MRVVVCHFCHFCNTRLASGHRRESIALCCRITRVTHITKIFFVNCLRVNQSPRVGQQRLLEMICRGTRGRGLHPRKSSHTPPQEVNGRVSYFLHEAVFFASQLSLTPPTAGRKRQASCYRSGHSFSLCLRRSPKSVFYGNHA